MNQRSLYCQIIAFIHFYNFTEIFKAVYIRTRAFNICYNKTPVKAIYLAKCGKFQASQIRPYRFYINKPHSMI